LLSYCDISAMAPPIVVKYDGRTMSRMWLLPSGGGDTPRSLRMRGQQKCSTRPFLPLRHLFSPLEREYLVNINGRQLSIFSKSIMNGCSITVTVL